MMPPSPLAGAVRDWFAREFPGGPTPAQHLAWPTIAARENLLLTSPTGTGKTLAAFLAIVDRLHREHSAGTLRPGLRCLYISPLRSLGYDIEANLNGPLDAIRQDLGLEASPIRVGVRTGDTKPSERRKLRDQPPHLFVTTPESLSLLLAQPAWAPAWKTIEYIIVDEIHALVPTKRGADLMASLERLSAFAAADPCRIGLSATCRPAAVVARFLVGPGRECRIAEAPMPEGTPAAEIEVESLIGRDEAPHRGLTYRRLLRRIRHAIDRNRTTVVFANTRAFAEKVTHDLKRSLGDETVAAHHSALDAARRREVEGRLKRGELRSVVTSTSLELGVDIGTADQTILVGLPGSAARCLQRIGRAGHKVGVATKGLLLAATAAEVAGAAVTASAAREGRVEPLRPIRSPLDVLCQQLLGIACGGEAGADEVYALLRRSAPFADLERTDLDACLNFLAGELAAPPGAFEPEPGATPRWTSPRIYKVRGRFGLKSGRVRLWFYRNLGTIHSEESVRVLADGVEIGTLEGAYAERLQPGDRFILDGRALEYLKIMGGLVHAKASGSEADLPRWTSDRVALSAELARDLAHFRHAASRRLAEGATSLRPWLFETQGLDPDAAGVVEDLIAAQQQFSEVSDPGELLVEESPHPEGFSYAFHAPLGRPACEALGRAISARLGRRFGRDMVLTVADLGWSIRLPIGGRLEIDDIVGVIGPERFSDDVLDGLDRGELLARRFKYVAATALMVLRNPEGGRLRVGGLGWVSTRLFPLVLAACPDHPLIRETRREVLEDHLDTATALAWLNDRPRVRFRALDSPSPFAAAWIDPGGPEPLQFEPPENALKRLHARLTGA